MSSRYESPIESLREMEKLLECVQVATEKPVPIFDCQFLDEHSLWGALVDIAEHDAESYMDHLRWVNYAVKEPNLEFTAKDIPASVLSQIMGQLGFRLACYIGEPALKVYLQRFIVSVFQTECLFAPETDDEVELRKRWDENIEEFTNLVVAEVRRDCQLPLKLDSLDLLYNAELWEDRDKLAAEMESWIHPDEPEIS